MLPGGVIQVRADEDSELNEPIGPQRIGDLLDRHGPALVLYARQLCAEPEDVVQAAFLKLSTQRPVPDEPAAWLYRVVRNEAMSARRAAARRQRREAEAAKEKQAWFQASHEDPQRAVATADALQTLTVEQREIVTAHIWGGLSFKEIAGLMEMSPATAHRRYQEALLQLRRNLGASCQTK